MSEPRPPSEETAWLERDGVGLFYAEHAGAGSPVVLVHGWCCDHSFMAPQFEHFSELGHRVIAVDLRGHGRSDRPVQRYAIADFSDDVLWMAGELGIEKPLIIGHSMGGNIAFDIAARYPDFPSAIVMIDSAVARPVPSRVAASHMIDALRGGDFADALRGYVDKFLFLPTDTPELKREILDRMAGTAQHVMVAAMEGLRDHDPDVARGRLVAPSLYIAADELPARSDMDRLKALVPQLQFGQTVGSGHFCQLEVPEQVNAMIDRFMAITFGGR